MFDKLLSAPSRPVALSIHLTVAVYCLFHFLMVIPWNLSTNIFTHLFTSIEIKSLGLQNSPLTDKPQRNSQSWQRKSHLWLNWRQNSRNSSRRKRPNPKPFETNTTASKAKFQVFQEPPVTKNISSAKKEPPKPKFEIYVEPPQPEPAMAKFEIFQDKENTKSKPAPRVAIGK